MRKFGTEHVTLEQETGKKQAELEKVKDRASYIWVCSDWRSCTGPTATQVAWRNKFRIF